MVDFAASQKGGLNNKGGQDQAGQHFELTPQSLFNINYIAPPARLSDYVTTLYHFRCDEAAIRDIQPASVGHLAIFPHGKGEMQFRDGRVDPSHETNLLTPFSVAAPFVVQGPFHAIGAVLSPYGWAALTGLDASKFGNRFVKASKWLDPVVDDLGAELCAAYRDGSMSGEDCAKALGDFILTHALKVNTRHAELIRQTNQWLGSSLNPALDDLTASAAYSHRQVQRLVERYFGVPPTALARKYRALRAAALLSFPQLTPEYEAELGEAFYDQSHMIKELRAFVGRTPARLSDDEAPYLTEMLDLTNFRELG